MGRGGRRAPPPAKRRSSGGAIQSSSGGGMGGGFLGSMIQGFAFGTGSSVAREMVHGAMGGSREHSTQAEAPPAAAPVQQNYGGPCAMDNEALMNCLQSNSGNASACEFYFNALQSCQANNK